VEVADYTADRLPSSCFGLAFAVLIDATVVRMVLVPALMELVGD
jgi:uncharacterized membrane protein YdfJ with MMPL/SSD domain